MRYKISKIITIVKKDGILEAIRKVYKYIHSKYVSKVNIFSYLNIKLNYKKFKSEIDEILNGEYDRIIIWRSSFGWNVPLFQRPQHIALNFSDNKCLVFYEITTVTDKVKTYNKVNNNLYLVNFNNPAMKKLLLEELKLVNKPKYIQFYSTDATVSVQELKEFVDNGYKIIYEYIDEISPKLLGISEIPVNIKEKYEYMINDKEHTFVVVTADELEKDVLTKRGNEKLVFSCNGVNYDHFANIKNEITFDKRFVKVLEQGKKIIGYYGALATWFDYEMVKYLAKERPDYNIVLLGIKYDGSFDEANLNECSNIYFLGPKKYDELPNYASHFDVCTIPFLINDITQATSPLKLFEYMAMEKPIVTTNMNECTKYKSVMIANDKEEFVKLVDKAIEMANERDEEYFDELRKESIENTWEGKAKVIIDLLEAHEK